ncbi:hypothetical protein N7448_009702 [Penicillium atrosanguineum]|uniref:DUF7730 domain-containing protein n=1 Tax=Penicillium atrosanguineum TaxID=1132637 RepID=A0A9W9GL29_9EURO|nr:uncharacterized protein N7443_006949 [Penicillium atrosanguineum]KAJ5123605.1 hypothetical protein N7448_009702 [Penicillium atrosanguineum]KAJ5298829.1 hypothetical protein N7443_006949 [Penicillium atrosanguineum]KAJ5320904.1 hypothetical protein N7476_003906 [Penicillium atrosanguineum]
MAYDDEDDDPIIWPPVACGNAEDPIGTAAARAANAPPLLPARRRRALTIPLPSEDGGEEGNGEGGSRDGGEQQSSSSRYMLRNRPGPNITKAARKTSPSGSQRTADQSQSRLLSTLPAEIRRVIWRHAVGGQLLHMARVPNRLVALECAQPKDLTKDLETLRHDCWCMTRIGALRGTITRVYRAKNSAQPTRPANLLPLLQTCRLVYTEAVSMLYQDNIFDIDHVDTLLYIQRCILPQRLHQITRLNYSWDFSQPVYPDSPQYKTWREACIGLLSLSRLQELTIHLTGTFHVSPEYYESKSWVPLLDGLKQVKAAPRYNVYVPWSEEECSWAAAENDFPFTLVSRPQKPLTPRKTAKGETITLF